MRPVAALLVASACVGGGDSAEPPAPQELVREGARPAEVRRGDLDGDGGDEVVIASRSRTPSAFGLPTPYLEVFARGDDGWERVFDASGHAPQGGGAPRSMLEPAGGEVAVGQVIELVELVDLEADGAPEIVAAISSVGATSGPLELWIASMTSDRALVAEYYMSTDRGGKVAVVDDRVAIEFPVYRRGDPGCCPSAFEVRMIGHDRDRGAIGVLDRERTRLDTP